jgi:hypothetical protein
MWEKRSMIALIKQPYTYDKPTGGFLHVTVHPNQATGSSLKIEFRDDTGAVLHSVEKR